MKEEKKNIIIQSIIEVMETVAFIMAIPAEDHSGSCCKDKCVSIRIDFTGPANGAMYLKAPFAFTPILAANMLGIEEDDPNLNEKGSDAYKEVLNIICGNTLPKLFGLEPVFKLSMPEIISDIEMDISDKAPKEQAVIQFDIEDNIVCFRFIADSELS